MTKRSRKIWNGNVRDAALSILLEIHNNQSYSNLLLHRTIEKYNIEAKDRGLLTELTYGTLQYRMTLDYYLEPFVRGKLDDWVRELLRMSIYQIVYLTRIPPHAVVHEAVEIAKRRGHKRIAPTVNGILRSVLRKGVRSLDEIQDPVQRIAIETSHPEWLIQRWVEQFGEEQTTVMAHENNKPASFSVRVNTTKATIDEVIESLKSEGIEVRRGQVIDECLISESGNIAKTDAYKSGLITLQDESSMMPAHALNVKPGMKVLDMCAAPGGKTTHIAELMEDEGNIFAHDLHKHKLRLIEANAERLELSSISTHSGDSRKLLELYERDSFDRILIDAPCSGFGVIRRKPEIKYTKTMQDVNSLQAIQLDLLDIATELLEKEGIIVYSTCTVEYNENQGVVENYLQRHPNMALVSLDKLSPKDDRTLQNHTLQVLPHQFGGDGFFIAAFQKKIV